MSTVGLAQNLQGLAEENPRHRLVNRVLQEPNTQALSIIRPPRRIELEGHEQNMQVMVPSQPLRSIDEIAEEQHISVLDVIKHRRSVGQVTREEPSREQIECILEAATYAPNHHVTEPWRFFVVTGKAREELGAIMAASLRMRLQDMTPEKKQLRLSKERSKPVR